MKCECEVLDVHSTPTGIGVFIKCSKCLVTKWENRNLRYSEFLKIEEEVYRRLGYGIPKKKEKSKRSKLRKPPEDYTNVVISDHELLMWRIDMALDNRDEVVFRELVKELEGVK